jgi:hypothetical protein
MTSLDLEEIKEPPFVKMYMQELYRQKKISGIAEKVFQFILYKMDNTNISVISTAAKDDFIKLHSISRQHFYKCVKTLEERDFLKCERKGEYLINPKYAVKSSWENVKGIEWKMRFDNDGIHETHRVIPTCSDDALEEIIEKELKPKNETKKSRPKDVQEVKELMQEKAPSTYDYDVEAERFVDFYTANGWKVGKNPMKDWKAAARNWIKNASNFKKAEPQWLC